MKINPRVVVVREAISKIVEMLAIKKIKVRQQGTQAMVVPDKNGVPTQVILPYLPDDASDALVDAVQGFLDHEVAHLLFTDFALTMKEIPAHDKDLFYLYNIIEDTRIERKMAERFQGSASNLTKVCQFVIDKMVEPNLEKHIAAGTSPGSDLLVPIIRAASGQSIWRDYVKRRAHYCDPVRATLPPDLDKLVQGCDTTADAIALAKTIHKKLKDSAEAATKEAPKDKSKPCKKDGSGEKGEKGDEDNSDIPEDDDDDTDPLTGDKEKGGAGDDDGPEDDDDAERDSEDEAQRDMEKDKGKDKNEDKEAKGEDGEAEGDGKDEGDGDESSKPGKDKEPREGERNADDDSAVELDSEDVSPGVDTHGDPGDADNDVWVSDGSEKTAREILEAMNESKTYDELASAAIKEAANAFAEESEYLIWSTDYDEIAPIEVPDVKDPAFVNADKAMQDRVDHMVGPMQKDLERAVAARSAAVYTAGHRSGKLHGASLARMAAGRDDVFRRKQQNTTKDVAVSLVVDGSGSMRDKIETASSAAYALSATLDRLSIANDVIAFTTMAFPSSAGSAIMEDIAELKGRTSYSRQEALKIPILKEFHERMTPAVRQRFVTLANFFYNGLRSNVDGESVQIAYRRLVKRREARKILIVLSDGYPAAHGDFRDLNNHLRDVVQQIQTTGVDVVGIGIRSDAVKNFYPKHVILNSVSDLPGTVMARLKEMLLV